MTEDEARKKWCPFARVGFYAPATMNYPAETAFLGNREAQDGSPASGATCIGSDCMAWRKTGDVFLNAATGALTDRDLTGNGRWIQKGRCGLAGSDHP